MTAQNPIFGSNDSDLGASAGKDTQGHGDDSLLASLGYTPRSVHRSFTGRDRRQMQSLNATLRR